MLLVYFALLLATILIPYAKLKWIPFIILIGLIGWQYGFKIYIIASKTKYFMATLFAAAIQYGVALGISAILKNNTLKARRLLNAELAKGKHSKLNYMLDDNKFNIFKISYIVDFKIKLFLFTIMLVVLGIFGVSTFTSIRKYTIPAFWGIVLLMFLFFKSREKSNPGNNYMINAYMDYYINTSIFMTIFVNIIGSQVFVIFGKSNAFAAFLLNCISSMVCWIICWAVLQLDNYPKKEFEKMVRFMCFWRYCQIDKAGMEHMKTKVSEIEDLSENPQSKPLVDLFDLKYPSSNWGKDSHKYANLLNESKKEWLDIYK